MGCRLDANSRPSERLSLIYHSGSLYHCQCFQNFSFKNLFKRTKTIGWLLTINQAHPVVQLGSLASLDEEDLGLGGQRGAVPGFESPPELLRFVGPIFGKDFALETVAGVGK